MFAQLGTIQFDTIKTFGEFSERSSATYAEHVLIEGKPKLQRTGTSLTDLNISVFFHRSFCSPKNEIAALKEAMNEGEILPLLWGTGELVGDFVITEVDTTTEEMAPNGEILGAAVRLALKEYVVDKLQQEQADARNNAKAVGDKKPVTNKKKNPSTCAKTISGIVNKIYNHYAAINDMVQTGEAALPTSRAKILSHLSASRLLDEDLIRRCKDPDSCASELPDLKYRAEQHLNSINNFNKAAANNEVQNYANRNAWLGGTARRLKEAAQKLINLSITRKDG